MHEASTTAPKDKVDRSASHERTCLATGTVLPKNALLRFVVGPDNQVVPDLAQNLPGRGMWLVPTRLAIENAMKKGLFSKAAKESVKADPGLLDQMTSLLRKRCLDYASLSKRAGIAVLGETQVEAALKKSEIDLLLLAPDAGSVLGYQSRADACKFFSRNELGAAFGHDQIVYAGLKKHKLTTILKAELAKLGAVLASETLTLAHDR